MLDKSVQRAGISVCVKVVGLAAGLMVLAKCSSQHDETLFAEFAVCWTAVGVSNSFAVMGIDVLAFKRASSLDLGARQLIVLGALVAFASVFVAIPVGALLLGGTVATTLLFASWACMAACATVCASALRGFQRIALSSFHGGNQSAAFSSLLALLGINLCFQPGELILPQLMIVMCVAQLVNLTIVAFIAISESSRYQGHYVDALKFVIESLLSSLPLMLAGMAGTLLFKSPPLLLWWLWQPAEIAGYLVAQRFIEGILMLQVMICAGSCSSVPYLFAEGEGTEIAKVLHISGMLCTTVTVATLALLLAAEPVAFMLFGDTAEGYRLILAIQGLGLVLAAWSGPVDQILVVTGRPGDALVSHTIGLIIFLIGALCMYQAGGGVVVVALVWLFAWSIARVLNASFLFRRMGIVPFFRIRDVSVLAIGKEAAC